MDDLITMAMIGVALFGGAGLIVTPVFILYYNKPRSKVAFALLWMLFLVWSFVVVAGVLYFLGTLR